MPREDFELVAAVQENVDHHTKVCNNCKRELPLNADHWYRDGNARDGFKSVCKECQKPANREAKRRQYKKATRPIEDRVIEKAAELILKRMGL